MEGVTFTPTEAAIMAVLSDGERHLPSELFDAIDDQADEKTLYPHLSRIRGKLPNKQAIICQFKKRRKWFRLVATL